MASHRTSSHRTVVLQIPTKINTDPLEMETEDGIKRVTGYFAAGFCGITCTRVHIGIHLQAEQSCCAWVVSFICAWYVLCCVACYMMPAAGWPAGSTLAVSSKIQQQHRVALLACLQQAARGRRSTRPVAIFGESRSVI